MVSTSGLLIRLGSYTLSRSPNNKDLGRRVVTEMRCSAVRGYVGTMRDRPATCSISKLIRGLSRVGEGSLCNRTVSFSSRSLKGTFKFRVTVSMMGENKGDSR